MSFEQQVENVAKTAVDGQDSKQDAITDEVANIYSKEAMKTEQFRNSSSESTENSLPDLQLDDFSQQADETQSQDGKEVSQSEKIKDSGKKPSEFLEEGKENGASGDIGGSLGEEATEKGPNEVRKNDDRKVPEGKEGQEISKDNSEDQSSTLETDSDNDKDAQDLSKDNNEDQSITDEIENGNDAQVSSKDNGKDQESKGEFGKNEQDFAQLKKHNPKSGNPGQKPIGDGGGHGPQKNPQLDRNGNEDQACVEGQGGGGGIHKNPQAESSQNQELTGKPSDGSDSVQHESQNSGANSEVKQQQEPLDSKSLSDLIKDFETKGIEQKIKKK